MKAVDRAYDMIEKHVVYGDELEPMSTRTRNALIKKIDSEIEWHINFKETSSSITTEASARAYVETLEKMKKVIA